MINSAFFNMVMDDIVDRTGADRKVVEDDFAKFNAEIDRLIDEEGLAEDEAIARVSSIWEFPFDVNNVDVDED